MNLQSKRLTGAAGWLHTAAKFLKLSLSAVTAVAIFMGKPVAAEPFDSVINGGRLIDPRNGIDHIAHIGIRDGRVAAISDLPLNGAEEIDARGMIVSPGFIDLHSHAISPRGQYFQALDGVTTALELEAGIFPLAALNAHVGAAPALHTGASSSHLAIRQYVLGNTSQPHFTDKPVPVDVTKAAHPRAAFTSRATEADIEAMMALHEQALDSGALGIGLPLDYIAAAVSEDELTALFDLASRRHTTVFVHMRRGYPGDLAGLHQVLAQAEGSGASVHICHLQSMVMSSTAQALEIIQAAVARGVAVTTEAYPYDAGSTAIGAAVFGRDWKTIFAIDYSDVQWVNTGERLTADRFHQYRNEQPNGVVVHHYGNNQWTHQALSHPLVMVASDAMPITEESNFVHPRGVGTFTRVLSNYVDELDAEGPLSMSEAIAKMTDQPGSLLSKIAPSLGHKGHLGVGADADITVLDPQTLDDKATYLVPLQPSRGVRWVLICGKPLVARGAWLDDRGMGQLLPSRCRPD